MNPLESFEKQLKESADMQVDHSASFIWEDLSKAIKPKKKKRRILLFWLLFSAVLTSGIIVLMVSDKTKSEQKPGEKQVEKPNAVIHDLEIAQDVSTDPKKEHRDFTPGGKRAINRGGEKKDVLIENAAVIEKLAIKKDRTGQNKVSGEFKTQTSQQSLTGINNSRTSDEQISNFNDGSQTYDNPGTEDDQEVSELASKNDGREVILNRELKSLDPLASLTITPSSLTGGENHEGIFSQPQCPTFREKRFSFFVELEGLAGIPLKQMNSGPEASKLYELRKSSEKPWYSAGAGLHFGMMYRNKFSVSTGLDWLRVNEKFDYSKTDIVDLIYHVDPNTGYVTGPFIVTKNITNSGQIRHTLMDIPVLLGYHMKSEHWNIGIQAGPFINLNLTSRGKIMTATDQVGQIKDQNSYKDAVGAGLQGSLSVSRNLTSNLSLYIKPSFKYYLNDWTNNEYPVRTKFNNASVSIGVRQTF